MHLFTVVKYFHDLGHRILIVHRDQITKYPHYLEMRDMAKIIQLSGLTSDDPYILVGDYRQCSGSGTYWHGSGCGYVRHRPGPE
jgi:hypothetical protein